MGFTGFYWVLLSFTPISLGVSLGFTNDIDQVTLLSVDSRWRLFGALNSHEERGDNSNINDHKKGKSRGRKRKQTMQRHWLGERNSVERAP